MSTVSPPVAAAHPVKDLLPGDEPGQKNQPPVSEDRHELDELPQGALVLLTQLQPLRELPLKLSLAAPRSGAVTESTVAKASVGRAMYLPVKQPSASSSPAPDQVAADTTIKHKAALSATRLAVSGQAQVPVQMPAQMPAQMSAPVSVQPSVAVAIQPDQAGANVSVQQSATQLPAAAQVPVQAAVASTLNTADQAAADRPLKQEAPQALPAQPLPLLDKVAHLHHAMNSTGPAKATPEPKPAPEAGIAKEGRSYLQVPFSKGDAVGLITVSKAGANVPSSCCSIQAVPRFSVI